MGNSYADDSRSKPGAAKAYTWRMLQSPGMFDMRGRGEYAKRIEESLLEGETSLADIRANCKNLNQSGTTVDVLKKWHGIDYETYLAQRSSVGEKLLLPDDIDRLEKSASAMLEKYFSTESLSDVRDEVDLLYDVKTCEALADFSCCGSRALVPEETADLYRLLWCNPANRHGDPFALIYEAAKPGIAIERAVGVELNAFTISFCECMNIKAAGEKRAFMEAFEKYIQGSVSEELSKSLQMFAYLTATAGNFIPVPHRAVCLPGERVGKSIVKMYRDFDNRADRLLMIIYRWIMEHPEPLGPGADLRERLERGVDSVFDANGELLEVVEPEQKGSILIRWICGFESFGNTVDRQKRWDRFVSRNYLHDYVGPTSLGEFGEPIMYDDDSEHRIVQMSARIIARGNRMRNAAYGLNVPTETVSAIFNA